MRKRGDAPTTKEDDELIYKKNRDISLAVLKLIQEETLAFCMENDFNPHVQIEMCMTIMCSVDSSMIDNYANILGIAPSEVLGKLFMVLCDQFAIKYKHVENSDLVEKILKSEPSNNTIN